MGLFQDIKASLINAKNGLIADNSRDFFNSKIMEYGTMTNLNIDSKEKNIHAKFSLEGESSEIDLSIYGYSIISENDEKYFTFDSLDTNRVWLTKVLKNVVVPQVLSGNKIKIDSKIAALIDILL